VQRDKPIDDEKKERMTTTCERWEAVIETTFATTSRKALLDYRLVLQHALRREIITPVSVLRN
jgi:hypothetical protein